MPEGSWKCEKCNNINYPFRTKCNRQNCGADKPTESKNSPSKPADENDQVCLLYNFKCYLKLLCCLNIFVLVVKSRNINVDNYFGLKKLRMSPLSFLQFFISFPLFFVGFCCTSLFNLSTIFVSFHLLICSCLCSSEF